MQLHVSYVFAETGLSHYTWGDVVLVIPVSPRSSSDLENLRKAILAKLIESSVSVKDDCVVIIAWNKVGS